MAKRKKRLQNRSRISGQNTERIHPKWARQLSKRFQEENRELLDEARKEEVSINSRKWLKNKKGTKKPRRVQYREYIKSEKWQAVRRSYFKRHKKECAICEKKYRIGLHHVSYKRLGNEADVDLIPLCWNCHLTFHELHGNKLENTHDYVIDEQEARELHEISKYF